MTIPMGVLLALAGVWAWRKDGADSPGIILGVCIGVQGADGWVGDLVHSLLQAVTDAVASLSQVEVL